MATVEPQISCLLKAVEPTSIQPGGGFCMRLEQAWGRLRRAYLRRLRPGYVRRMAGKRRGQCENCSHDIIDPRDLKLCRNVCGYWFRDEDNPFRWRDRIPLARAGMAEVISFSAVFLGASLIFAGAAIYIHRIFWMPAGVTMGLWLFVISFFRDPERTLPTDPNVLVSPADGTVTHVDEVEEADFPGGRALRISIFLSVFNVHVNRIPRAGRVLRIRYFPGAFLDARHAECAVRNEQLWVDLEEIDTDRLLRVKQISGAIARRIVCWLKPGELVQAGARFGMIKFGSRTEVLLPATEGVEMNVKVGDKVRGGNTVLLRWQGQAVIAP